MGMLKFKQALGCDFQGNGTHKGLTFRILAKSGSWISVKFLSRPELVSRVRRSMFCLLLS